MLLLQEKIVIPLIFSSGNWISGALYLKAPFHIQDSVSVLTDRNFLGTGHEFKNSFRRNNTIGISSFIANYSIPNFRNTYVSAKLHYEIDGDGYFNRGLNVERPFFSPVTKWAGGLTLASRFKKDSLIYLDPAYVPLNLEFRTQDYWAGKATQIFKGNSYDITVTNLILAAALFSYQILREAGRIR